MQISEPLIVRKAGSAASVHTAHTHRRPQKVAAALHINLGIVGAGIKAI